MPDRHVSLDRARLDAIRHGCVVVPTRPALFEVTGPGAIACLQGILTNDIEKPGQDTLVYGALLTSKGMIVTDLWTVREPARTLLLLDPAGREAAAALFTRSLPPRLAKARDRSTELAALWLVGAGSTAALGRAGVAPPAEAGRVVRLPMGDAELTLARGTRAAPFAFVAVGPDGAVAALAGRLTAACALAGTAEDLDAARILAGWPRLGAEIDEKTLVQEVRFDEIDGVSYTKGCFTGQETVARLHFRGHTNRELRGLRWTGRAPLGDDLVLHDGKEVGRLRSVLTLDDRILALAPIRREVATGATVLAGGREAVVVAVPFADGGMAEGRDGGR